MEIKWLSLTRLETMMRVHTGKQQSCRDSNLLLKDNKTKEFNIDFRKYEKKMHKPVYISGSEVKQVNSFRFLGNIITVKTCHGH